jgi:hypothetical protein
MAAQYAENPPSAPMGYDWNAAPLSPGLMNFAAQRGQPGVIQKTLGLIPGFDQDGKRAAQSWGNALMSTAQFPIDAVAGMGQALTAPARAYRGEFDPTSEEGVGEALNVAGNAMMGGLAAPKPRNVVGSAGGDLKGAALGAIPDTPGIRATNISDISTAGPLPNRILAYHGAASKFDNLDLARAPDVGLHYGTLDVTDQFSGFRDYGDKRGVRAPDNSRIYPVILDGSRMARAADGALFDETAQAHSFLDAVKKGKIEGVTNATPGFADLERNMSALPYGDASANPIVRDWLTSNGLDGVIYPNTYDGSGVSAMMWKNVRSALGNNDLLYANGGRGGAATGAALGAPQSMNDPALAEILRKYGLDLPSRPASPQYRPGDA